jgi:hypothetical protein
MIVKFVAHITLDLIEEPPKNEAGWEAFNMSLETIMEEALEENNIIPIDTAEVVMEEQ